MRTASDTATPKMEEGDWQVVRFCCTSGQCIECRATMRGGKRKRVVQLHSVSEATAIWVAKNWANYEAKAERMPAAAEKGGR